MRGRPVSEYTPDLSSLPLFADPPPVADQPPARHATPAHRYVHRERHVGAPHMAPRTPRQADVRIDWGLVRAFRQQAADQLAAALREREGLDEAARHELGRGIVLNLLSEHADEEMAAGSETFSTDEQQEFAGAIFDSLFGLGRLQPLVDHPDIENIEISGCDNVHLVYSDGRIESGPPVADSDEELIEFLAFLASRSGGSERPFSPANPRLHLRLAGGSRLAATAWITPRPSAVIRRHRLTDIDLADLVARGTMDDGLASFLAAAVRARRTVVVSGGMGAGKALATDTPVPTPIGWTAMGALRAGDQVFDERGLACTVLAAHEVQHDRPCFEVEFDDGEVITADADHLWRVTRLLDRARRTRARASKGPAYHVGEEERKRLHALAERASERADQDVTVAELVREVGDRHRQVLFEEARTLSPVGHVRLAWAAGHGAPTGRDVRTYSRQQLLKALAVRRDTPRRHQRPGPDSVVLTTAEMATAGVWRQVRSRGFAVDLARPLQYPRQEQFIDPYILGVWLGDGAASCARIATADPEVLTAFEASGYPYRKLPGSRYDYAISGSLQAQLRTAGVLGDKHIPRNYLHGDVDQRLALLHGLMDSDGTCTKSGACEFSSTSEVLAQQTHELIVGLGYRPTMRSKAVRRQGRDCGRAYTVAWTTRAPMFRLARKLQRQERNSGGPTQRYIVDFRRVDPVPVRCITVDSPSSLFLAGRSCVATHNTTLIRALCNELDPLERIGTIETEYELHLHEMTDRHQRVVAWEARPGSGERGPDGKSVGEITLDDIVYDSLRYNLSRVIVGEVRGREVLPMFKAMQAGAGSLSTTHARSGRAAIERLVTCAMEAGPHVTEAFAYRQIAEHIDLIVQINMEDTSVIGAGAQRRRFISEVIAVEAGEHGMPAVTDVYRPGDDGRAVPGTLPQWLKGLASAGFDIDAYTGRVA